MTRDSSKSRLSQQQIAIMEQQRHQNKVLPGYLRNVQSRERGLISRDKALAGRPPNAAHMPQPVTAGPRNAPLAHRTHQEDVYASMPKTQRAASKLDNVEILVPPPKENHNRTTSRQMPGSHRQMAMQSAPPSYRVDEHSARHSARFVQSAEDTIPAGISARGGSVVDARPYPVFGGGSRPAAAN